MATATGSFQSGQGSRAAAATEAVADVRFRALLGEEAWGRLPEAVRRRFSKRLSAGEMALYQGEVVSTRLSIAGKALSLLTRIIGAPLPTMDGATGPAVVTVTEDARLGGQRWLRLYERPGRKPQLIQSTKRFRGETGLEEYVGAGIGMQLKVSVEDRALVFRSARYVLEAGLVRVMLPRWLAPGSMTIVHRQEADGRFSFGLRLEHALFGVLLDQVAYFKDV